MKISKNIIMQCIFYFVTYISFALPYGYMQTFLAYVGYDVVERGIILSGCAVVAIVLQFFVGYLCDKFKTDKWFYNIFTIIFVIATYIMYSATEQIFFLHLIFVSLVGGVCRSVQSIQDAWCLETDEDCSNNFGPIRAFGAIGWMIGSPIGAAIIEAFGYKMLGIVFAVLSVLNIIVTMFMQDAVKVEKSEGNLSFKDVIALMSDRKYVLIVLVFLCINIIAMGDQYTMVDKMMALGATESLIGVRWSLQAFMELPLFFAGGYLLKKFGDYKLMIFGTVMYIIRFVLYAIVQTPQLMIAVAMLQCVTYPLIMITSKTLVDKATPTELRATGQTVASSIYAGVSMLVAPALSGVLVGIMGLDLTLAFFGFFGVIAIVLSIFYKK